MIKLLYIVKVMQQFKKEMMMLHVALFKGPFAL